jgi:hypothetical protein
MADVDEQQFADMALPDLDHWQRTQTTLRLVDSVDLL